MNTRQWTNRWICDPVFATLQPINLYHKEREQAQNSVNHNPELKNIHTLFRRHFTVPSGARKVTLNITGDDYYKLYINGTFLTSGPGCAYHFHYPYQTLDLTPYVQEGDNLIAVHVYYHGLISRSFSGADYRQGLIAEITADGRPLPGEDWLCSRAEEYGYDRTFGYDTQFNEIIDLHKKQVGWTLPGFDDSGWTPAAVKEDDDHVLTPSEIPLLQFEKVTPVSVKEVPGGYLIDFGVEITGTLHFKAFGRENDRITIRYGEELLNENEVRHEMRCNCDYEDVLILTGKEDEPDFFDYKCFRYVQLLLPPNVSFEDLYVLYRHYPFDDSTSSFHSEDELVNRIWEISKNAVRNCCQESFLDCPQREKGAYLGDMPITAHSLYYLTGDTKLFRKALHDFAQSTRICPGMMAIAPGSLMQEIADYSLLYPFELLLYHRLSGDLDFLRRMLPVAEGVESYFDRYRNADGLLELVTDKWNLVDWPANLRDDYDFALTIPVGEGCHNVLNAHYVGMKLCMEELRELLGVPYEKQSDQLKAAFQKTFFCEETGLFTDSATSSHSALHSNVISCFYGLQPKNHRIIPFIREKGLCCGVYVAYFLLFALLKMGEKELAYELITNRTEHSWYQMIQEGATTAFEAWGKDQKWNTSLCHSWASAPIPVLMEMDLY